MAHLFTHCQWALSVILNHTAVWVSPELQLPVPKEVLAETEDLSGECAVAENALMYPKMDMTAPVDALFH